MDVDLLLLFNFWEARQFANILVQPRDLNDHFEFLSEVSGLLCSLNLIVDVTDDCNEQIETDNNGWDWEDNPIDPLKGVHLRAIWIFTKQNLVLSSHTCHEVGFILCVIFVFLIHQLEIDDCKHEHGDAQKDEERDHANNAGDNNLN